jgi:enterochelin esterase-like enzyme
MDWINVAKFHESAQKLMAEGRIQPFVTIIPAGESGYWTDWPDGKHPYARVVLEEYLKTAEELYPLLEGPEHRGIGGISMGGFGALSIGLRHPDVFGFVVALSPTDMELALKASPRRKLYLDVVGRPANELAVARINPWHLVQAGAGAAQSFVLLSGSREMPKFYEGTKRLAKAMQAMKRIYHLKIVPDAVHGWATWSGEKQDWWLSKLVAFWPPDPSPSAAPPVPEAGDSSGQP